jgi:small subunit ribosomal protein S9
MSTTQQNDQSIQTVGRRKRATARVTMKPGTGIIMVNGRTLDAYFCRETLKMVMAQPFELLDQSGTMDIRVNVKGGGLSGQAGAILHGISRGFAQFNPDYRAPLKKAGFLTRDDREVERKKPGQPKARAKFQFSKR